MGNKNKGNTTTVKKEEQTFKILLLGSGESGKTTIHKQIKIIFDKGFTNKKELEGFKNSIYANILSTISALGQGCKKNGIEFSNKENAEKFAAIDSITSDSGLLTNAASSYTTEVHEQILSLWKDQSIQDMFYKKRHECHIFDGAEHFMENLDKYHPEKYTEITNDDILYCRRKSVGIVEFTFSYGGRNFKLFDVGGQRSERKKWIHYFKDCNIVMFVSSLGDYDLLCYEDDSTNRMKESMEVFEEIVNGDWFKKTHIFLLFNKIDVFTKKIKTTDLNVAFKDYDGGLDYEKALKFVTQKFLDLNKFDPNRIHVSTITATDQNDIGKKFEEIANQLISNFKNTKTL